MTTVKLEVPIEAHGEMIHEITLERPKVKHLKVMSSYQDEIDRTAALIAELGKLPPSAVDQIDAGDFMRLAEVIGDFFGGRQATGGS